MEPETSGLAGAGAAADAGGLADDATVVLAPVAVQPVTPSTGRPDLDPDPIADRRRILWRDSATILIGVILALLAFQTFAPGGVGPTASETPFPSGVSVGTLPPPVSLPPGVTFGPIVDPSLGVDATPTPIPVITLGPSPSPSPSPSPEPPASRKPTPSPTKKPTPRPTTSPPPSTPPPSTPPTPTDTATPSNPPSSEPSVAAVPGP